jgi:phage terminase large subunit-like protein
LQPLFNSGKIRISKRHHALIEELRFYPKGTRDDILDSLEMTVRIGFEKSKASIAIMARKGYYR